LQDFLVEIDEADIVVHEAGDQMISSTSLMPTRWPWEVVPGA
jgi:hypothetical protein